MPKIHIIHVGSVSNKGTLALTKSQIFELRRIYENPKISVSTCDVDILRLMTPDIASVPLLIDIPHEKADLHARRRGVDRNSSRYLLILVAYSIRMIWDIVFSIVSSFLFELGFRRLYKSSIIAFLAYSDLVISTADENFKEGTSSLPFNIYWRFVSWTTLLSRTIEVIIARRIFKKTIIVFPNSVGPFRTRLGRFLVKTVMRNVDMLFLRETYSLRWIEDLKLRTSTVVTSDIALLTSLEIPNLTVHKSTGKPIVAVCPGIYAGTLSQEKGSNYTWAHSRILDRLVRNYNARVIFLPLEVTGGSNDDYAFSMSILKRMENAEAATILKTKSLEEFITEVAKADFMLSSRMHPAVIACSYRVPTVIVQYDFKQRGLLDQLGLSSLGLDINEVSYENLLEVVETAWKNRNLIRSRLDLRVPVLQNDIRKKLDAYCRSYLGA